MWLGEPSIQVAVIETVVGFEYDRQVALLSWLLAASYLGLFEASYWFLILRREDCDITPTRSYHYFFRLTVDRPKYKTSKHEHSQTEVKIKNKNNSFSRFNVNMNVVLKYQK